MKKRFKINLYDLLSKDMEICRFKDFHNLEVKTVMLFLMQVGEPKKLMTKKFKKMIYLNENICIKKTYISYMNSQKLNEIKKVKINLELIGQEIQEYEKLRDLLLQYIEEIDSTENKNIFASFQTLILYEESMQKLYEEEAKSKEKILKLLKKITK